MSSGCAADPGELGELDEHVVARGMAMDVVDALEVVDVEDQQRQRRVLTDGVQELALERPVK